MLETMIKEVIDFFSKYSLHTALFFSVMYNLYLLYAWVKRERYYELTEIEVSFPRPSLKFTLNKDEKYRAMANEIIRLKSEVKVLKKDSKIPLAVLFFMILIATILTKFPKFGKKATSSEPIVDFDNDELLKMMENQPIKDIAKDKSTND